MFLNIYYWEKLTFSKLAGNVIYRKENLKKSTRFEEQKGTRYIPENVYFGNIIFSCLLSIRPCLRFLLNFFVWDIKDFYQSSLESELDFRDILNVFPNILAENWNFKKLRYDFIDKRALITMTLISSCHWKTLASFCWRKKDLKAHF